MSSTPNERSQSTFRSNRTNRSNVSVRASKFTDDTNDGVNLQNCSMLKDAYSQAGKAITSVYDLQLEKSGCNDQDISTNPDCQSELSKISYDLQTSLSILSDNYRKKLSDNGCEEESLTNN